MVSISLVVEMSRVIVVCSAVNVMASTWFSPRENVHNALSIMRIWSNPICCSNVLGYVGAMCFSIGTAKVQLFGEKYK